MNAVLLPADLQAWAEAEVAAGHADNVRDLVAKIVSSARREQQQARLKVMLDEAQADIQAGRLYASDEVFGAIRAKYKDRPQG